MQLDRRPANAHKERALAGQDSIDRKSECGCGRLGDRGASGSGHREGITSGRGSRIARRTALTAAGAQACQCHHQRQNAHHRQPFAPPSGDSEEDEKGQNRAAACPCPAEAVGIGPRHGTGGGGRRDGDGGRSVAPAGDAVSAHDSVTVPEYPVAVVTVIVEVEGDPGATAAGVVAANVNTDAVTVTEAVPVPPT